MTSSPSDQSMNHRILGMNILLQLTCNVFGLDAPTQAPGWRAAEQIGEPEEAPSADESQIGQAETETKGVEFTTGRNCTGTCQLFLVVKRQILCNEAYLPEQAELAKKVVRAVCEKMEASEAELNALDGAAGDGDCGSTFVQASKGTSSRCDSLVAIP